MSDTLKGIAAIVALVAVVVGGFMGLDLVVKTAREYNAMKAKLTMTGDFRHRTEDAAIPSHVYRFARTEVDGHTVFIMHDVGTDKSVVVENLGLYDLDTSIAYTADADKNLVPLTTGCQCNNNSKEKSPCSAACSTPTPARSSPPSSSAK